MKLNDYESEMEVISKALEKPKSHADIFELQADDFDKPENKIIFRCMKYLHEADKEITHLSVRNELQKQGFHKYVDNFVVEHHNSKVNTQVYGNAEYAIERLKEMSKRRMIWYFSQKAVQNAQELSYPVEDIMLDTEKGMQKVSQRDIAKYGVFGDRGIGIDRFSENNDFLPTGLSLVDSIIAGFFNTHLIIIAGRTSFGKTSLAATIAKYNSCRGDVLFFLLEMMKDEMEMRLTCMEAELESHQLAHGLNESQMEKFNNTQEILKTNTRTLKIYDSYFSFRKIINECKRQAVIQKPVLIVIDYLQLVECPEVRESRRLQLEHMTRGFKNLATQLKVPVVVLSQLSRASVESTEPQLHHLRESGSIEQDANMVLFVHRKDNENFIIVAKNRQGRTGKAKVDFEAKYFRFKDHVTKKVNYFDTLPMK